MCQKHERKKSKDKAENIIEKIPAFMALTF